jgi:putative heme-binding domain-containing protein
VVMDTGSYRRGMAFRVNRDFTGLETVGHNFRNPYELALDSYGTIWQSDNDDDGNRAVRINFVMEFGNYGYRDEMTNAGWRTPRLDLEAAVPLQHWYQNSPGVVPNVLLTGAGSPAGIMFYEGDLLPDVFRNSMIHADPGPRVVRAYPHQVSGAGYTATIENILAQSDDPNFRPVDVAAAPDGSLFIADWYDPVVGGHDSQNFDQGRIIRVAPRGHAYRPARPDLSTAAGAVQALQSPNHAVRYLAYTRLEEMGAAAQPALRQLWAHQNPAMRARALWLLVKLDPAYIDQALGDADPNLRITGLRAARMLDRDVLGYAERLMRDPSPQVRREVAVAMRYETGPRVAAIWTELARQYDGQDRWYLEALGIAADRRWDTIFPAWQQAVGDAWRQPAGRQIVWRARTDAALPLLTEMISDPATGATDRERYFRALDFHTRESRERTLLALIQGPAANHAQTAALALMSIDSTSARQMTPQIRAVVDRTLAATRGTREFVEVARKFDARDQIPHLIEMAFAAPDSTRGVDAARLAIQWGGVEPFAQAVNGADLDRARRALTVLTLVGGLDQQRVIEGVLLSEARPMELRRQAVQAFGVIQAGTAGPPAAPQQVGQALAGPPPSTLIGDRRLLELVQENALSGELRELAGEIMLRSPRVPVRTAATELFPARPATTADGRTLPPIEQLAARSGDAAQGRVAYQNACAMCHVAEGQGIDFGPPLNEIGGKLGKNALYQKILHPNTGIAFNYQGSIVRMTDGREFTGIVVSSTPAELALKTLGGVTARHPREQVAMVLPMEQSLMPAGLERALTEQELVNLVEYLSTLRSTALR